MEKVSPAKVGERIRAIRGERTQTEFAKDLKVRKQNYISRYERGRIPSPQLLVKIADMGKVTIDWLLTGKKGRSRVLEAREPSLQYRKDLVVSEMEKALTKLNGSDKRVLINMVRKFTEGKKPSRKKR